MSKNICSICNTEYQSDQICCPQCGCANTVYLKKFEKGEGEQLKTGTICRNHNCLHFNPSYATECEKCGRKLF